MTSIQKKSGLYWQILTNGKYSYKTNEYCQKNNIIPPYDLCYNEIPLEHLMLFIEQPTDVPIIQTTEPVIFKNVDFGSQLKPFLKQNPRQDCYTVQYTLDFEIRVYGYRRKMYTKRDKAS